jgi:hypothetical protein
MSADLTKQFSLDYLISSSSASKSAGPASSSSASNPAPTDPVFQALSQPILRKLDAAPNRTLKVFELLDQLAGVYGEIRAEAFAEIINRLESAGRIRVLQRDRYGNHQVQLV